MLGTVLPIAFRSSRPNPALILNEEPGAEAGEMPMASQVSPPHPDPGGGVRYSR
jgi:hypothetical protein